MIHNSMNSIDYTAPWQSGVNNPDTNHSLVGDLPVRVLYKIISQPDNYFFKNNFV